MLKFRCQHCGQRIAVPARHLGKLVLCSECGAQTHPLAAQLVNARTAAPAPAPRSAPAARPLSATGACANCGGIIGRLQASHEWASQRVCGHCHHLLSSESARLAGAAQPATLAVATRVAPPPPMEVGTSPLLAARERVIRTMMVFVVGAVALYGALTLLRDIAGLIAVAAVGVLALLALYAIFRARLGPRFKTGPLNVPADSVHPPETVLLTMRAR